MAAKKKAITKKQVVTDPQQKFQTFATSLHVGIVLQALVSLLTNSESFKKPTEFDTLYGVAMADGEKELIQKFTNLVNDAIDGNLEALQILDGR